mmetsp:Transcript_31988/g.41117  ORF Transcript_31988/g.41117 Transcript_31988/m.41117 type:complete len:260 (+) Transcript_31988:65-844(+)
MANASASTVFLEDYLEHITTLPNEIRRNLELMRDLDKESSKVSKDLEDSEKKIVSDIKRKGNKQKGNAIEEGLFAAPLEDIQIKRQKVQQTADEKVQIAGQMIADCDIYMEKLDGELAKFEEFLRTSGDFSTSAASPGDQMAAKPDDEWILTRVKEYNIQTGMYTLIDVDEPSKYYTVPEQLTMVLEGERIGKGEEVYAVYPDTTSFYPGIITSVPRRNAAQMGSLAMYCAIQFVDDFDETGATPDRLVPMNYIFRRLD